MVKHGFRSIGQILFLVEQRPFWLPDSEIAGGSREDRAAEAIVRIIPFVEENIYIPQVIL